MNLKLISHVNGDSDLIEAWLKYYSGLGVNGFHLVLHGEANDNRRLLSLKDSFPITIEDEYRGPFLGEYKKSRLDTVLARYTEQWIVLVDSDEFVEFPYGDIPETIKVLADANANLMAAPMLQRLTSEGSLETPFVIEDPFQMFPLCSVDLYRRMGVKGDIFKFPLFFCAGSTRLAEEGNHHPPLGCEPRASGILGVTHHFKFRRTVSERLDKRINSEYWFRHESVQFREYLEAHSNKLPLEGSFVYSRDELFRKRLLRKLPSPQANQQSLVAQTIIPDDGRIIGAQNAPAIGVEADRGERSAPSMPNGKKIMFVLPKEAEFSVVELRLCKLLRKLGVARHPSIICFDQDLISARVDHDQASEITVRCLKQPETLKGWIQMIRDVHPEIIVFCYSRMEAFPWQSPVAALLAGVHRRFSIQHLIPPLPIRGWSPRKLRRRLMDDRVRHPLALRLASYTLTKTICVSKSVRDALVNSHGFLSGKTVTVLNGVSTLAFAPSKANGAAVRARMDIEPEEFVLVCVARLVEAKGIDILLQAVSRVLRQAVPIKCIILGDGPLKEELRQQANSLGLSGYVFFEGFQIDVRPYLQAASAFILTSHIEGLPLSVLEAMACGVPCIVTDVGGNAEAVKDRVTGLVISPGSLDEAENAILYLVTHSRECAEMAIKARETVCQDFNVDKQMGEMVNAILN